VKPDAFHRGTARQAGATGRQRLEGYTAAMAAHGLEPSDFIISKDNSASSNARPLGPFFYDYTVFVGGENFTVTEPNDARFFEYFLDRILAPDEEPAPLKHDTLFSRLARWMAQPI